MNPNRTPSAWRRRAAPLPLITLGVSLALMATAACAADTSAVQQLERWGAQAGSPGQPERGRVFFSSRHGGEWSCATCHGSPPLSPGKHASTGKAIDAMAPAANPKVFTDTARVDKWFRRNCNDVLKRECSAGEKADVLAYLISLEP
jgi:hypothetical protein